MRSCCSTPRIAVAGARSATSAQAPCRSTKRSSASATIHISWTCTRPTVEPLQRIDAKQECCSLETTGNVATAQYYDDGLINELSTLQRDGIVGKKGAFSRKWVERLNEDMMTAFWEAIQRPGGAVGRGPRRWYVEVHPQAISGFIDIVTHPWINAMAEGVLGPDYEIVEIGFDVPFQGAKAQPWHRDFPSPKE